MTTRRFKDLAVSLGVSLGGVVFLLFYFHAQWETNDDVAMSMVAHGYGLAAKSSPNIVFSNILWGYFVRAIPQIGGLWGYSIATIGVLILSGWVIAYALRARGWGWGTTVAVCSLLLTRSVLFPQFTINAGLLTVGAIACWALYGAHGNRKALAVGCALAVCGYLVRSLEFFLVILVAAPLLPWRQYINDRRAWAGFVGLIVMIGAACYFDWLSYRGEEWRRFHALNPVRVAFTDFGAAEILKGQPQILSRYEYTANDLALVAGWFFIDRTIANPNALKSMLGDVGSSVLGPVPLQKDGQVLRRW